MTADTAGSGETIASGLFSGTNQTNVAEEEAIGRSMKEDQDYTLEVDPDSNATISGAVTIREFY